MTQLVRALAGKPDGLNSIPEAYVGEGKNELLKAGLYAI